MFLNCKTGDSVILWLYKRKSCRRHDGWQDKRMMLRQGKKKRSGVVKHTVKDSVFTSLLRKKISDTAVSGTYPEDTETTEDDLKDVTVSNVLVDDIYNDLGFTVGTTIMLLIEVQSTWTVNIIFRGTDVSGADIQGILQERQSRTCIKVKTENAEAGDLCHICR